MLREQSANQLEQIIDYGDKKNGISVDMKMRGKQALVVQQQQTSQNEIALPDAIKAFLDQRRALGKVGNKHIEAQESELALLCEIVGQDKLVSDFDGASVRHVRDTLIALPKKRDTDDAISELHILEAVSVEGVERITGKTVNGYLGTFRTFFKWLVESKYLDENPFQNVRVEEKKKPVEDRRQAYSDEALQATYNALVHGNVRKESYKWASLVAMFTGARLAEVCQLEIADIVKRDDIWCIEITGTAKNPSNLKSLKSEAARRIIPVHSHLQEIGFGDFSRRQRNRYGEDARLFQDYKHHKDKGSTKNFGRWYNESFMPKICAGSRRYVLHELRHTMNTKLLQAGVVRCP